MPRLMRLVHVATLVAAGACGADVLPSGIGFSVGPAGGKVTLASGAVVLNFPANAIPQGANPTATPVSGSPGATVVPGTVYDFQPSMSFSVPVQVTLKYQGATLPTGVRATELGVYKLVGAAWQRDSQSAVDTAAKTVTALLTGFSTHGILGAPVASVSVAPAAPQLHVADTLTLGAAPKDASSNILPNRTVTWVSKNTSVATVNSSGLVTAVALGTDTVTATSEGISGQAVVTVAPAAVASVTIAPSPAFVTVGTNSQLAVTTKDAGGNVLTGRTVTWASSNTALATVNGSGLVTGVAAGTDTVTATSENVSGSVVVIVQTPAQVTPVFQDDFEGQTLGQAPAANAQNGYQWTSSTASVTVSSAMSVSGGKSLGFSFGPNALTVNADADAEQRFELGTYLPEVWLEYMLYVPSNFVIREVPLDTYNNKFFALWKDVYSGASDWIFDIEYQARTANDGAAVLRPTSGTQVVHDMLGNILDSATHAFINNGVTPVAGTWFITPGAWTQIRLHFKMASGPTANDGEMEVWANGVLCWKKTDGNFFGATGVNTLKNGYLLGYANSGFTNLTVFYIDDFKIYAANPGW